MARLRPVWVNCPTCNGAKEIERPGYEPGDYFRVTECPVCDGMGSCKITIGAVRKFADALIALGEAANRMANVVASTWVTAMRNAFGARNE